MAFLRSRSGRLSTFSHFTFNLTISLILATSSVDLLVYYGAITHSNCRTRTPRLLYNLERVIPLASDSTPNRYSPGRIFTVSWHFKYMMPRRRDSPRRRNLRHLFGNLTGDILLWSTAASCKVTSRPHGVHTYLRRCRAPTYAIMSLGYANRLLDCLRKSLPDSESCMCCYSCSNISTFRSFMRFVEERLKSRGCLHLQHPNFYFSPRARYNLPLE